MDIGWKNQGSYSFFLLQSKKPHSVIPPPAFFFPAQSPAVGGGGGWGAGSKTERWERGGLFRVKVMVRREEREGWERAKNKRRACSSTWSISAIGTSSSGSLFLSEHLCYGNDFSGSFVKRGGYLCRVWLQTWIWIVREEGRQGGQERQKRRDGARKGGEGRRGEMGARTQTHSGKEICLWKM